MKLSVVEKVDIIEGLTLLVHLNQLNMSSVQSMNDEQLLNYYKNRISRMNNIIVKQKEEIKNET